MKNDHIDNINLNPILSAANIFVAIQCSDTMWHNPITPIEV